MAFIDVDKQPFRPEITHEYVWIQGRSCRFERIVADSESG
jgi:hypothetical protein